MNEIIVGNISSLCAMITDSISGTQKKRSRMLAIQILSQVFYGTGSIILKGYSGTTQNAVAILRNFAAIKNIKSRVVEWALIALGVVLGAVFNNRGLLGWLPIIANLEYSVAMFRFKTNERALKISFIINMLMFVAFSLAILNYVAAAGNVIVAVTTAVSLIKGSKGKAAETGEDIDLGSLKLADIRPSQFYISEKKLRDIEARFDPAELDSAEPIPIKLLDGVPVMTDGHTRSVAALRAGLEAYPLVWDTDELDWDMYRRCVEECGKRGVFSPADLLTRIVSEAEYDEKWNRWCDEMHADVESARNAAE